MMVFTRDYYGMDPLISGSASQPLAYKGLTPLFVFNVSKQNERLNHGVRCSQYKSLCFRYK